MKNLIITSVLLGLSVLAMQNISGQTHGANGYDCEEIKQNPAQEILPDRAVRTKTELTSVLKKPVDNSLSNLRNDLLNSPDKYFSKSEINLNEISTGRKNYTKSVLIGGGIGLAAGILIDIAYYTMKSYGEKSSPGNFGELFSLLAPEPVPTAPLILIPVGSTLLGMLIGAAVAPEERVSFELYGRNAGKRKINDSITLKNNVSGL